MPMLRKANRTATTSVIGGPPGHYDANDGSHEEMAINRIEDGD
jgi:hypothetical protein